MNFDKARTLSLTGDKSPKDDKKDISLPIQERIASYLRQHIPNWEGKGTPLHFGIMLIKQQV